MMAGHKIITLSLVGLISLAGCHGDRHHHDDDEADTAAIAQQIRASETQWNAAYAARDASKLAAQYAPDAALANPGVALVSGGDAIRAAVTGYAADKNLKVEFASDRVQVAESGDLAYSRGHFTMQSSDPATGKPRSDSGSYLTVWQKQPDGQWKAVEDFVTPGAPAPAK
jgi:uncharacterized protein (TIGR02246 family)